MSRNTRAIINLANIRSNFEQANRWAPQSLNMAIIKADAYGHGAISVAKSLAPIAPAFGVAIFEEAIKLREAGINNDLLVLQGSTCAEEFQIASEKSIWLTVHSLEQLEVLLSTELKKKLKIWLKIDTGLHRLGMGLSDFASAIQMINECRWLDDDFVVFSHFSCASDLDNEETLCQFSRFKSMLENLPNQHQLSLANSPAIVGFPETNLDWNRPGILLFGLPLFDKPHSSDHSLKAAMSFESEIIGIRTVETGEYVGYGQNWIATKSSIIATVAVGYADGYPRQAKNGTPVIVRKQRAYLTGTVSMDLISIDVSEIPDAQVGDKVELWGENLSANEVAKFADTIGYDLVTGVSKRVPRIYL